MTEQKLIFDDWIVKYFEADEETTGKYYDSPYQFDEHGRILEYNENEVVDKYLEYFSKKGKVTWGPGNLLEEVDADELTKIIYQIDEEILGELDTGETPLAMIAGNLMRHNICEFYNSTNIPTNPKGTFKRSLLNIHPTIFMLLREWLEFYHPFINWKDSNEEDFWECIIN